MNILIFLFFSFIIFNFFLKINFHANINHILFMHLFFTNNVSIVEKDFFFFFGTNCTTGY